MEKQRTELFVSNERTENKPGKLIRNNNLFCFKKLFLFWLCFAVFIALANPSLGAVYYVNAINGNDSNPGTMDLPWRTIQWAESNAVNGSTVFLYPGNYGNVAINRMSNNGRLNWSDGITFTKLDGYARPELQTLAISGDVDRYLTFDNIYVNCTYGNGSADVVSITSGGYVKISNSEIKGVADRIHSVCGRLCEQVSTIYLVKFGTDKGSGVRGLILENSHCHHSKTGVRLEGNSYGGIVIRGNHIHDVGESLIKLAGDTHGQTVYIDNNHIATQLAMWRHDPKFEAGGEWCHGSGLSLRCENVTARNNIIRACAASTQITTYRFIFPTHGYRNMRFENNLLYDSRSPYYSVRLDDVGSNLVFNNNTVTGRHYDGRTKAYYYNNVFKLDKYAASVDQSTIQVCNNIFVGIVGWPLHNGGIKCTGNMFYSYLHEGGWADQNWMNANMPGNKVYCWNTNEPAEFRTSGVIFRGGELFDQYAYKRLPTPGYVQGRYHNVDLGDSFDLAEGSDAIGFAHAGYSPANALGSVEGNNGFIGTPTIRDAAPDAGCYELGSGGFPGNTPPVLTPIGNKSVVENEILDFAISATDDDNDPLSYSVTSPPDGSVFNRDTATFTWTPQSGQSGNYSVTFTVSDGSATDSETVNIKVLFLDEDMDSLPDWWEMKYFGGLSQGPEDDFDGDGFVNLKEYQNSSDPTFADMQPPNRVLHMRFNDSPADGVADSSLYGNNGACPSQASPAVVAGYIDNAYEYDGDNDCVIIPDSDNLDVEKVTLATWLYIYSYKNDQRIISKEFGTAEPYSIYSLLLDGMGEKRLELRLGINGLRYRIAGNSDIPLNQWVHVAATYDGDTARLYVNGQPDRIYTELSGTIQQNDKPVYIGGSQFYNRYFDGVIDEVHIYNNALSAEEILSLSDGTSEPLAFAPIGDKEVNEVSTLTFEVNVLIPDVNVYISEHSLPSESNFSRNTFNWTPTYDDAGGYDVTFAASRGMIEDFETITITVNNVNRRPVIEPVGDQTVDENTHLGFTVGATDPDGDSLTYFAFNIPAGATFTGQSFDWTPGYEQAGLYVLNFGASDGDLQDVDSAIITVINNNRPPLLQPIGDKSIAENELLSITIVADDDDNDLITYSAQNLPTGAEFSGDTFIWTPGFGQAGSYQVTITASDGQLQDSETITITVVASMPAPDRLVGYWRLDDGIGGFAADSSGSGNTGILLNGPAWTIGKVNGGLVFDGTDDYINCGSDSSLNVTGSLTIAAWINPNGYGERGWGRIVDKGSGAAGYSLFLEEATASIAYVVYGQYIARSNYNVVKLNQWQHVAIVYDAESSLLSFYVDGQAAGTVSYDSAPVSASDSPLTIGIRGYDLKRAFDGKIDEVRVYNYALSRPEIVSLANPILNRAPILDSIGDKTAVENEGLMFSISAADADGDAITYSAENLPVGAVFTGDTFHWLPAVGQAGIYQVTFTASDGWLQDMEIITITVSPAPQGEDDSVGRWKFDEGTEVITEDTSGKGNTGSLVNGAMWTMGVAGKAIGFDGIDDYVDCGADESLNITGSLTIAAWINPRSYGQNGWGRIVDKGSNRKGYSFFLEEATGAIAYVVYGGLIARSNHNLIMLNQWQHVAVVYDKSAGSVTFYVNGQHAGTTAYSSPPLSSAGCSLVVGIRGYDLKRAFDGIIDEVQVYNYALSQEQMAQLP